MTVISRKRDDGKKMSGHIAHVKMRCVELDVEGGSADLVEGFKSFVTVFTSTAPARGPVRTLPAARPSESTSASVVESMVPEERPVTEVEMEVGEEPASAAIVGNEPDRPRRRAAPKAPKFLSDLDLTKATVKLADFIQAKNPNADMDKFAVIAVWFKQHLNTEEVTIDHIFTAYRTLGWQAQLPDNPSQTFLNVKHKKSWFDNGSKRGAYKVNWNGESAVNKMGVANP